MKRPYKRDPSETLRFAIYENDAKGKPQIVAEYDQLRHMWCCRFCDRSEYMFNGAAKMGTHVLEAHLEFKKGKN